MRKSILLICFFLLPITPSYSESLCDLESAVIIRAQNNPSSAYEYFLEQIEDGATPAEQAVYLYGMGLAREQQNNFSEALNDHLAAEALGNKTAAQAVKRLQEQKAGK
jgi:hypothetical protein